MEKRVKKYLEKRESLIKMIEATQSTYETDECYHSINLDFWQARILAEKILSKFGINKPQFVKDKESEGYAIGPKYTKN